MPKSPYTRPTLVQLDPRMVTGSDRLLSCMPGDSVAQVNCTAGDTDAACYAGASGSAFGGDCVGGSAATGNYSCLGGSAADWECAAGSSPTYAGSCTVGSGVGCLAGSAG